MEHPPPPPLRTGRFSVGKTTAQRTGLKIKLKKILTVTFHEGHYVLDFNQGQKAPSKLNTSKLSKKNKPLRVDLYLRTPGGGVTSYQSSVVMIVQKSTDKE